jgi:hypothetical protein
VTRPPLLDVPSATEIRLAPERASLALLNAALVVSARALIVEHPTAIARDEPRALDPPTLALARGLLDQFDDLRAEIARYLAAVERSVAPVSAEGEVSPF